MTFAEADGQFEGLRQRYQMGALSAEQYDAELRRLMVMDGAGRWWAKARESGLWHYYDANADRWIPAAPSSALIGEPPAASGTLPGEPGQTPATGATTAPAPAADTAAGSVYAGPTNLYSRTDLADISDMSNLAAKPALSSGVKSIFLIFSLLFPLLGVVLFFVYRRKPHAADRAAARLFLILGVVSLVLSCLCSALLTTAVQAAILNWGP